MPSTRHTARDKRNTLNQPSMSSNIATGTAEPQATEAIQRAQGGRLQPADVVALQRTVGNQVVQRLLGKAGQQPPSQKSPTSTPIQRLTVEKTRWQDAGQCERTNGSVGAVIVHDQDERQPNVIVKYVPTREKVVKSHKDLYKRMGVSLTPGARTVEGKERRTVEGLIGGLADKKGQVALADQMADRDRELIVMEFISGTPAFDDALAENMDGEKAEALGKNIGRKFFYELGKIVVYDVLTENHDRIKMNSDFSLSANMQNLLVSPEGLPIPIDNTRLGPPDQYRKPGEKLARLPQVPMKDWTYLFQANSLFLGPAFLRDEANFEALQEGIREGLGTVEKFGKNDKKLPKLRK